MEAEIIGPERGDGRFAHGAAYIEGEFVPIAEARIPILDWGFLRSDATYDVVHVWEGRFFRLDDHIDRIQRGVRRLEMQCPYEDDALRAVLNRCVALAGLKRAYVEMICTRGTPRPGSCRSPASTVIRSVPGCRDPSSGNCTTPIGRRIPTRATRRPSITPEPP